MNVAQGTVYWMCQRCWEEESPDQYWPDEMDMGTCEVCHDYVLVALVTWDDLPEQTQLEILAR